MIDLRVNVNQQIQVQKRPFWVFKEVLVPGMAARPPAFDLGGQASHIHNVFETNPTNTIAGATLDLFSLSPLHEQGFTNVSVKESTCNEEQTLLMLRSSLPTHLPCSRTPRHLCQADLSALCGDQIGSFYLFSGRAASLSALPLEGVYLAC